MIGAIFFGILLYFMMNDFNFTFDLDLFIGVLIGSAFWGLVAGYLFGRSMHLHEKELSRYIKDLNNRLRKNRKFNKTIYEFNIMKDIKDLETFKVLWEVFKKKIVELEDDDQRLSSIDRWYEKIDLLILEGVSGKRIVFSDIKTIEKIQIDIGKNYISQLEKLGLIQINIILAKFMLLIQDLFIVKKGDVDEINIRLTYYMYTLKLGMCDINEFQEFLDINTLKDNPRDVFIDLQVVSYKSVNEIIEVLYHYFVKIEETRKYYFMKLIFQLVSFDIINRYRNNEASKEEIEILLSELYGYFPDFRMYHYIYNWEYNPQYGDFEAGIKKQAEVSININDFLGGRQDV